MGLFDDILKQPKRATPNQENPALNQLQALGLLNIPGVSDTAGLAGDAKMFLEQPDTRTPTNFGLSAAGLLPGIAPAGLSRNLGPLLTKAKEEAFAMMRGKQASALAAAQELPKVAIKPTKGESKFFKELIVDLEDAGDLADEVPTLRFLEDGSLEIAEHEIDKLFQHVELLISREAPSSLPPGFRNGSFFKKIESRPLQVEDLDILQGNNLESTIR